MSANGRETRTQEKTATKAGSGARLKGLTFKRVYTDGMTPPFDALEWELRTAAITNERGEVFFEQKDVEVPKTWSMTATNIVAQKYFRGTPGAAEREWSVMVRYSKPSPSAARANSSSAAALRAESGRR